jgi:hypothetical protein
VVEQRGQRGVISRGGAAEEVISRVRIDRHASAHTGILAQADPVYTGPPDFIRTTGAPAG